MPRPPSDAKQYAVTVVDGMHDNVPPAVKELLEREGLSGLTIPLASVTPKCIEGRLAKAGVLEQARAWKRSFVDSLKPCLVGIPRGKVPTVGREIAWRVIEQKAEIAKENWLALARAVSPEASAKNPYVDNLPPDIKWVYLHPGLAVKDADDGAAQEAIAKYEQANPAPSTGARNRYVNMTQGAGAAKAMEKFYAQIDRLMLANQKDKSKPSVSGVGLAEEEAIADLETVMYAKMTNWRSEGEKEAEDSVAQ